MQTQIFVFQNLNEKTVRIKFSSTQTESARFLCFLLNGVRELNLLRQNKYKTYFQWETCNTRPNRFKYRWQYEEWIFERERVGLNELWKVQ